MKDSASDRHSASAMPPYNMQGPSPALTTPASRRRSQGRSDGRRCRGWRCSRRSRGGQRPTTAHAAEWFRPEEANRGRFLAAGWSLGRSAPCGQQLAYWGGCCVWSSCLGWSPRSDCKGDALFMNLKFLFSFSMIMHIILFTHVCTAMIIFQRYVRTALLEEFLKSC